MDESAPDRLAIWRSPVGIALLAASAVGAYFLLTNHFDHFLQAAPFLFLLACPLMHVFHRGHHRHRDRPRPELPVAGNEQPPR